MPFEVTFRFDDLVLAPCWARAPEGTERLPALLALGRLADVASSEGAHRLLELADALDGPDPCLALDAQARRQRLDAALRRVGQALERGDLLAFVPALPWGDTVVADPEADVVPAPGPAAVARAREWVEIVLLGEDGSPVAGERYVLTLPDGEERTGQLDAQGRARIEGIGKGECQLTLPRLDRDAWERAAAPG